MLLLKIVRLILGYVKFTAHGGFPERFLNLCRIRGVSLWDVMCIGETLSGYVDRASYKKLRHIAAKSGMKMRLSEKHGFSFFLDRHSGRVGAVAGIFIMAAILGILSTRLWTITVTGNEAVSAEEIISAFQSEGVRCGVPVKRIVPSEIELAVQGKINGISWLNINIVGSAAHIEVRETVKTDEKEKKQDNSPSNIIASKDGTLVILRPFSGSAEEKAGSPVLKGDLLISGITQNRDLTFNFCKADGYAVAQTNEKISSEAKRSFPATVTTGVKKRYKVGFFSLEIPFGKLGGKDVFEVRSDIRINGITLPLSLTKSCVFSRSERKITLDERRCRLLALSDYFSECNEKLKYVSVKSLHMKVTETQNGCFVSADAVCLENIGQSQPFEIETG